MTELLTWRDAWLLDIELLDAGHREMVWLINRLADADHATPLPRRLTDLIEHLRRHFHVEQVFLHSIDYPDIEQHSREHALQLAELVDLSRRLAPGDERKLGSADMGALKDWFLTHVIASDRRFAAYYREIVCGA